MLHRPRRRQKVTKLIQNLACANEPGRYPLSCLWKKKNALCIFFSFFLHLFGAVKSLGSTLILDGAEERPEARPRRSKTTKKVKKIIKNAIGDHAHHYKS